MTEGLFILTTIFVAYVVYAIIGEQKASAKSKAPAAKPEAQAAAVEQPKPQVAVAKKEEEPAAIKPTAAKPVAPKAAATKTAPPKPAKTKAATPKVAAAKAAPAKPAAAKKTAKATAAAPQSQSTGLKDPKTGEVATAYSNYRFTKRWIKDALVAEGLLEKVYPNNELNSETETKIKEAIGKLEAMDKYKA